MVGLAAIVDIEQYSLGNSSCEAATVQFMNGTVDEIPTAYEIANPVGKRLHSTAVLLHGDADQIVPISQASLEGAETLIVEGAGHFDWIHPGSVAFAYLIQVLERLL